MAPNESKHPPSITAVKSLLKIAGQCCSGIIRRKPNEWRATSDLFVIGLLFVV
jgi:hypothetical protein